MHVKFILFFTSAPNKVQFQKRKQSIWLLGKPIFTKYALLNTNYSIPFNNTQSENK